MTDLEAFFQSSAGAVDKRIGRLFGEYGIDPPRLKDAVRWSMFGGGKRFRPALILAVGQTIGVPAEKLFSTAAAVEMIHTYSLIHDDLPAMDDDDLRRGRETCHKKFGEATAILAGDALQVMAFKAIADDANLPVGTRLKLSRGLAAAALRMVAGQQMDLEYEGREVSAIELETMHARKTGALISFSAEAALEIGEVSEPDYSAISEFAARLGLLFQISDDVLDITQTTDTLGKTAGKDASSKKATYPSVMGLERSRELIREIHREAVGVLDKLDRPTGRLCQIADFIVNRVS